MSLILIVSWVVGVGVGTGVHDTYRIHMPICMCIYVHMTDFKRLNMV